MVTDSCKKTILIVEDDTDLREAYEDFMRQLGFYVQTATCVEDALRLLRKNSFEILFTDFNMPGGTGADLIAAVQVLGVKVSKIVLATSLGMSSSDVAKVMQSNPHVVHLEKPFSGHELRDSVCD